MDHERYPYYADPRERLARAERTARLREAAARTIFAIWSAAAAMASRKTKEAAPRGAGLP